jgi:hypothetical protein
VVDDDGDDGITTADGLNALTTDLAMGVLRLQEILGEQADRPISSLPRWQREEVLQIQRMLREWNDALKEARRS